MKDIKNREIDKKTTTEKKGGKKQNVKRKHLWKK